MVRRGDSSSGAGIQLARKKQILIFISKKEQELKKEAPEAASVPEVAEIDPRWVPTGADDLGDEAKIMEEFGWTEENLDEVEQHSKKEE